MNKTVWMYMVIFNIVLALANANIASSRTKLFLILLSLLVSTYLISYAFLENKKKQNNTY